MKLVLRATALLVLFVAPSSALAAQTLELSGKVLDDSDAVIYGVQIQAYRDGRAVTEKPTVSDRNGEYKLEFDEGKPIETVRYDHSDFFAGTIEKISGRNNHKIHKTLYRINQAGKLATYQVQEILSVYERVLELDHRNNTLETTRQQYAAALKVLERLPLPLEIRNRPVALRRKYDIP